MVIQQIAVAVNVSAGPYQRLLRQQLKHVRLVVQPKVHCFYIEILYDGLNGLDDCVSARNTKFNWYLNLVSCIGHNAHRDLDAIVLLE